MRRPDNPGRIIAAIALSLVAHALLLTRHVNSPQPRAAPPAVDVVLDYRPPPPVAHPPQALEDEPTDTAQPLEAPPVPPPEPPPTKTPRPVDEDVEADDASDAPPRLDLEWPDDWDDLVAPSPEGETPLRFNPGLEQRVRERETTKRRRALVERRAAATYGVPDELYAREGAIGTETKIDGRCYVLKESGYGRGTQWSPSTCTETRQNPFTLKPIERDALGRAVAD